MRGGAAEEEGAGCAFCMTLSAERVSPREAPQAEGCVLHGGVERPVRRQGRGTAKGGAVVGGVAGRRLNRRGVQHLRCVPEPPNLTLLCGARGRGGVSVTARVGARRATLARASGRSAHLTGDTDATVVPSAAVALAATLPALLRAGG